MNIKKTSSYLLLTVLLCNFIIIGTFSVDNYLEPSSPIISNSKSYSNYLPIEESLSTSYIEALNSIYNESYALDYELRNKQEISLNPNKINSTEISSDTVNSFVSEPYYGITNDFKNSTETQLTSSLETSTIFGTDDRERVQNTTEFPFRTICKLYIKAQDGSLFIGSGAIIDSFHVLTCGHCVYIHDHGGYASEIKVVPGKDLSSEPYGHAYSTDLRTFEGWISDEDSLEDDLGLITLDRYIGNSTGWMGLKTENYLSSIYHNAYTAGYPSDLNDGEAQYNTSDNQDADTYLGYNTNLHRYKLDVVGGQSGSPVWNFDGGERYIISVIAYSSTPYNFGPRLTLTKYNTILSWLDADPGIAPEDSNLLSFLFTFEFWLIIIGSVSLISVVIVVVWYRRKSRTPENERETGEEEEEYYYY